MSEPRLSDQEMAVLAGLAARAEATDPRLAHVLRGSRRSPGMRLPAVPPALSHWAVGAAVAVIGLVLAVGMLAVSVPAAVAGGLLMFAGAGRVAVSAPWNKPDPASPAPRREPSAD
ncbi:MAG: DUF3040 domain-containing protein [Actinomycetota bacterium]|nr:DUF3040 domain-containing protein [Actinomycetota bacterium]